MQKVMSFLKSGQFWVGFVAGAVAASAFSFIGRPAKALASKIPGTDAAKGA